MGLCIEEAWLLAGEPAVGAGQRSELGDPAGSLPDPDSTCLGPRSRSPRGAAGQASAGLLIFFSVRYDWRSHCQI